MPTIWVTSDHHLGHSNFYSFKKDDGSPARPFSSAEEADEIMIQKWNEVVKPEDHVWHLGDFTCHNTKAAQKALRLNGKKRIVLGNHDFEDPRLWWNLGFHKVTGMHQINKVWLTHVAMHPDNIAPKFLGNAVGHIHYRDPPKGPYVNVSVERWDYFPVEFGHVKDMLRNLRFVEALKDDLDRNRIQKQRPDLLSWPQNGRMG